jgi:alpha-tubulin suppressor-like RCC1 family protein
MLSAGFGFTCGVTTERGVLCWGSNVDRILGPTAAEQCGDVASIPCSSRPVSIAFPEPAVQLSSGTGHACAVSESGTVYCWGANTSGQVGIPDPAIKTVPIPARVGLPDATHVSSGGIQTCALTAAQLAYCWGADALTFGRNSGPENHAGPTLAAVGQPLRAISAGQIHVCALDTNRRLLCWGDTALGALGIR